MDTPLVLTVELETREIERVLLANLYRQSRGFTLVLIALLLAGPGIAIALAVDDLSVGREYLMDHSTGLLVGIAVAICLAFLYKWAARRQIALFPEYSGPVKYTIGESGFICETSKDRNSIAWDALSSAQERKREFVLFRPSAVCLVIPKRSLNTEENIVKLRKLVRPLFGRKIRGPFQ